MKYVPATSNVDRRLFFVLLTPSWLSATVCIAAGLLVSIGTLLTVNYHSSSIRLQLLDNHLSDSVRYQTLLNHLAGNSLLSNLPLLIFWALIGLVVYLFVTHLMTSIRSTTELAEELNYVNADRKAIVSTALKHLLLRVVILILWGGYIMVFFNLILPYCVTMAFAASAADGMLQSGLYLLFSAVLTMLAMHLQIICLRLLLLRPRVFATTLYID